MTYDRFLAQLPDDRRTDFDTVWQSIRRYVAPGFTEHFDRNMVSFQADKEWYVALANQKNYLSLYLMPTYHFADDRAQLDASGKKLKMGKSCINFSRADDLPLDVVGQILAQYSPAEFLAKRAAVG